MAESYKNFDNQESGEDGFFLSLNPIPPILHASAESRSAVLRHYSLTSIQPGEGGSYIQTYINFEVDVVYFPGSLLSLCLEPDLGLSFMKKQMWLKYWKEGGFLNKVKIIALTTQEAALVIKDGSSDEDRSAYGFLMHIMLFKELTASPKVLIFVDDTRAEVGREIRNFLDLGKDDVFPQFTWRGMREFKIVTSVPKYVAWWEIEATMSFDYLKDRLDSDEKGPLQTEEDKKKRAQTQEWMDTFAPEPGVTQLRHDYRDGIEVCSSTPERPDGQPAYSNSIYFGTLRKIDDKWTIVRD